MSKKSVLLKSSVAKKVFMALTGLFLVVFLLGHLAGNLQLLLPNVDDAARLQFNAYAKFMTTNPAVKILSYLTYFSIIFHAIDGLLLTIANRKARPIQYAVVNQAGSSHWTSRNMGVLGTIILAFIVVHMSKFWYQMHFGELGNDTDGNRDLYEAVIFAFKNPAVVAFYVLAMFAVGFHLYHGFSSGLQTLGAGTRKLYPTLKKLSLAIAVIIPLLFAIIPVYILLSN